MAHRSFDVSILSFNVAVDRIQAVDPDKFDFPSIFKVMKVQFSDAETMLSCVQRCNTVFGTTVHNCGD